MFLIMVNGVRRECLAGLSRAEAIASSHIRSGNRDVSILWVAQ